MLVTELMGQGVNGVTGDYSRGASGYWVENGVQAYPVHEITIAGNLKEMYRNIAAIGSDVDLRGGVRVGSILIARDDDRGRLALEMTVRAGDVSWLRPEPALLLNIVNGDMAAGTFLHAFGAERPPADQS